MGMEEETRPESVLPPAPSQLVTAGFLRRLVASLVDGLIFSPLTVLIFVVPNLTNVHPPAPWEWALWDGALVAYGVGMLGRFGWTVGMRVLKVRVSPADGGAVGYKCAAVRTFAYVVPGVATSVLYSTRWTIAGLSVWAAYVIAVLWMIVDSRHQAYHDKIARTLVVRGTRPITVEATATGEPPQVVTLPTSRSARAGKWAAYVALSILAIAPLAGEWAVDLAASRAQSQVETILADLKAQGQPLTSAELAPPPVPDAENAALVYEQAYRKLELGKEAGKALDKVMSNWRQGLPLGHKVTPDELESLATDENPPAAPASQSPAAGTLPSGAVGKAEAKAPGTAEKAGSTQRGPAGASLQWSIVVPDPSMEVEVQPGEPSDAEVLSAANKALERNNEALALTHKAAGMQECRPRSKDKDVYTPWLPGVRTQSKLLQLEAMVLFEQGDKDGALRSADGMFAVGDSAGRTPALILALIEMGIYDLAVPTVERILCDSAPSGAACQALEARVSRIEVRDHLVRGWEFERASGLEIIGDIAESPNPVKAAAAIMGNGPPAQGSPGERRRHDVFIRWWLASEELFYLRTMGLYIELAKLRPFEQDPHLTAELQRVQVRLDSRSFWPPRVLSTILVPRLETAAERAGNTEAAIGLARIALLLKAYRDERGANPESLDELERYAGKELPLDPWSGGPFHYRPEASGFILYSLGTDGVDDGGKVAVQTGSQTPIPYLFNRQKGGDIVWVCKQ